jgi:hypothetical protein
MIAKGGLLYDYSLSPDAIVCLYVIASSTVISVSVADLIQGYTNYPRMIWDDFVANMQDELIEADFHLHYASAANVLDQIPTLLFKDTALTYKTSYQAQELQYYILSDDFRLSYAFGYPNTFPAMTSGWSLNIFFFSAVTCVYRRVKTPQITIPIYPAGYYSYVDDYRPGYRACYPQQGHYTDNRARDVRVVSRHKTDPLYDSHLHADYFDLFSVAPIPPQSYFSGAKTLGFALSIDTEVSAFAFDSGYFSLSPFSADYPPNELLATVHLQKYWEPMQSVVRQAQEEEDPWQRYVVPPQITVGLIPMRTGGSVGSAGTQALPTLTLAWLLAARRH